MSAAATCLRGVFDKDDDRVHPLVDNGIFKDCPAGMRFDTKEVCEEILQFSRSIHTCAHR